MQQGGAKKRGGVGGLAVQKNRLKIQGKGNRARKQNSKKGGEATLRTSSVAKAGGGGWEVRMKKSLFRSVREGGKREIRTCVSTIAYRDGNGGRASRKTLQRTSS